MLFLCLLKTSLEASIQLSSASLREALLAGSLGASQALLQDNSVNPACAGVRASRAFLMGVCSSGEELLKEFGCKVRPLLLLIFL